MSLRLRMERAAKRKKVPKPKTPRRQDAVALTDHCDDHCDDYIDNPSSPVALRTFLEFARAPAHGQLLPKPHPKLYADYEGTRVRVTVASRLGDVGITTNLDAEFGYERRVLVRSLSNFSELP